MGRSITDYFKTEKVLWFWKVCLKTPGGSLNSLPEGELDRDLLRCRNLLESRQCKDTRQSLRKGTK